MRADFQFTGPKCDGNPYRCAGRYRLEPLPKGQLRHACPRPRDDESAYFASPSAQPNALVLLITAYRLLFQAE